MSLKESNMLRLGTHAPDFKLPDTVSAKVKMEQLLFFHAITARLSFM
jgi:peroxiredoxin